MRRRTLLGTAALAGAAALTGCDTRKPARTGIGPTTGTRGPTGTPPPSPAPPRPAQVIADNLNVPWALAFLPGGDALVSERETGRILRVSANGGTPTEVMRIPDVATDSSEGGLLGIAVAPTYPSDTLIDAYYTTRTDNRIVRFTAGGQIQPVLTGLRRGSVHNGGRIAFGPEGRLYAGVGETGSRGLAQDRAALNGKILRINPDGTVPPDNPFRGSPVWTWGHRNVQGLAWDSAGLLWATEFGQDRFDEVNLIVPGRNYGWPDVEGVADTAGGRYTNPVVTWTTAEASPSGAAILGGKLYVGALRGESLWEVRLDGPKASIGQRLLHGLYGRIPRRGDPAGRPAVDHHVQPGRARRPQARRRQDHRDHGVTGVQSGRWW
jgi:glucose/arabinose dehydrogenase